MDLYDLIERRSAEFLDLRRCVDDLFEELVFRKWPTARPETWEPALDLYDLSDAYLAEIDLPSMAPEDVRVTVEEHRLIVEGFRPQEAPPQSVVSRRERKSGEFRKALELPDAVDPQKVRAEFYYGTCRIYLAKKPPAGQAASPPPVAPRTEGATIERERREEP
jgi:HSP20 family protein